MECRYRLQSRLRTWVEVFALIFGIVAGFPLIYQFVGLVSAYADPPVHVLFNDEGSPDKNHELVKTAGCTAPTDCAQPVHVLKNPDIWLGMSGTHVGDGKKYQIVGATILVYRSDKFSEYEEYLLPIGGNVKVSIDVAHDLLLTLYALDENCPNEAAVVEADIVPSY